MKKVIKTDTDYEAALAKIDQLLDVDPDEGSREFEELELLTLLVRDFEAKNVRVWEPDPVDAIEFRMEQQGLSHRDLVPFIGSRGRVSEVLSRKRPLTLAMIRGLHRNLGIPARVLLQDRHLSELKGSKLDWTRFPLKEMTARNWIKKPMKDGKFHAEEILTQFFSGLDSSKSAAALYRQTHHMRAARRMDNYALLAWTARVIMQSQANPPPKDYQAGVVNREFMVEVARLSWSDRGPLLAIEFLRKHGLSVVIEPHLPRTHLDGAAILVEAHRPVIGLTIRHDRIDSFWFCLMHELAHIAMHVDRGISKFFDDLDSGSSDDPLEVEADNLARDVLISDEEWARSAASMLRSVEAAESLARKLRIHPAIVAGRIRYEFKSYRVLNQLVGHREVRALFPEISWE